MPVMLLQHLSVICSAAMEASATCSIVSQAPAKTNNILNYYNSSPHYRIKSLRAEIMLTIRSKLLIKYQTLEIMMISRV
jgi:hypothetical protein